MNNKSTRHIKLQVVLRLLIALLVISILPGCAGPITKGDDSDKNFATMQVFYGTDRNLSQSDDYKAYGPDRGEFSYGTCLVSIPREHEMGELESPSVWRFEFREDPEKHVVLLEVESQSSEEFFFNLKRRIQQDGGKSAFIFIHGYNVSFEDAARRTAQMAYDLGFDGAPMFYSWPSQGTTVGYTADETDIKWTTPHLAAFIEDVARQTEVDTLHLIAHSMGNRALVQAVSAVAADIQPVIGEIVLAAPDIDADIFVEQILPRLKVLPSRLTLYASSNDKALGLSQAIHGYPRAGDSGDGLIVEEGLDTIDASSVETDFLGHGYFAENRSLISDLFYLLRESKPPSERSSLIPATNEKGEYWLFRK